MSRDRSLTTTIALVAIVAALAVAVVLLGVKHLGQSDDAEQREKAAQAARQMGVNLMTLDYNNAQRDLDRIVAGTTGNLKNQLATQSKTFMDQLAKTQAKSGVSQVDAGLVSLKGDSAEVMVSLNGTVTNPKVTNGVARPYRFLMDLTRSGDRWLVSKLEMVP
ncbi:hypothetical protein [Actinomadura macrotermitis]|uniref:Mce-associated membrane protein n=1 Tax=Actinomadura macrotermitis TaxID=2585200 RepID=A0A7K0BYB2_9ACTN|nr:hypothetical protein [Actinomadura macrotermitis]